MKNCTKCKNELEEEQFAKSNKTKDGLQAWCKSCMSSYAGDPKNRKVINAARMKIRRAGYYIQIEKPKRLEYRLLNIEKAMWMICKSRAKKYNLPFSIEISDIKIPEKCPLLEIPIVINIGKAKDNSPTLDKIIPELGYVKGNIQVISRKANWMKSNGTIQEFETFYKNIFNYLKLIDKE